MLNKLKEEYDQWQKSVGDEKNSGSGEMVGEEKEQSFAPPWKRTGPS